MLATLLLRQRGALGQAGWLLRAPWGRRGTCPSPSRGKPHGEWPAVGTDLHTLLHPYSRRALFNVPTMHLPQLFTSTLPGTHRRTHSCPRRTERHCELLTSVEESLESAQAHSAVPSTSPPAIAQLGISFAAQQPELLSPASQSFSGALRAVH